MKKTEYEESKKLFKIKPGWGNTSTHISESDDNVITQLKSECAASADPCWAALNVIKHKAEGPVDMRAG